MQAPHAYRLICLMGLSKGAERKIGSEPALLTYLSFTSFVRMSVE